MTRDDLLAALLVERYTSPWWTATTEHNEADARLWDDSETTTARRRRELAAAWDEKDRGVA